jgi:hypothetical protein
MPGDGLAHGPPAKQKAGGSYHRFSQIIRHSPRGGVNAYRVLSLGTGLSCSHRPRDHHPRELGLSVGRPGPHAFTSANSAARRSASSRPPHPAPRS